MTIVFNRIVYVMLILGVGFIVKAREAPIVEEIPAAGKANEIARLPVSSQPSQATVTRLELASEPMNATGPCPATIKFYGSITTGGPGRVTYTFTRNDGATGPEFTLDFAEAGTRQVNTNWTLGDEVQLPHYEGWQSIKILSPKALESNRAKFVLDCKSAGRTAGSDSEARPLPAQPRPQSDGPAGGIDGSEYLRIWPLITGEQTKRFKADLSILKNFASQSRPGVSEAAKAAGYDPQTALADYRVISEETDASKRADKQAQFDSTYKPIVATVARNSNVDWDKEGASLASELNVASAASQPRSMLVIESPPPPPPPPPPTSDNDTVLRQPWPVRGTSGERSTANPQGNLTLFATAAGAGESHQMAFLGAPFSIEPGVTRFRATALYTPAEFEVRAFSLFIFGYASAEAIVNIRIMEGSRVVASGHTSLTRERAAVIGWAELNDSPRVVVSCDYNRPDPQASSTYTVVTEIEAYAGAGGSAGARVWMNAFVNEIRIVKNTN